MVVFGNVIFCLPVKGAVAHEKNRKKFGWWKNLDDGKVWMMEKLEKLEKLELWFFGQSLFESHVTFIVKEPIKMQDKKSFSLLGCNECQFIRMQAKMSKYLLLDHSISQSVIFQSVQTDCGRANQNASLKEF